MKRLKQINESKQMILEGFMRLLEHDSFDQITVSQIALEAGVTRMTLYRHFKEKEDILIFHFEQNLGKAVSHLENTNLPSMHTLLEYRFRLLKESKYTTVLARQNKLTKLSQTVGRQFIHRFHHVVPKLKDEYDMAFLTGGLDAMTIMWINQGMKESPEFMASKLLKAFTVFTNTKEENDESSLQAIPRTDK